MNDTDQFVEDFLAHFGVKGMKWGVRRAEQEANASGDYKNLKEVQTKAKAGGGTKALSNRELQEAITRMNLENQFSDLKKRRSKISRGYNMIKGLIGAAKTGQDAYNTGVSVTNTVRAARSS